MTCTARWRNRSGWSEKIFRRLSRETEGNKAKPKFNPSPSWDQKQVPPKSTSLHSSLSLFSVPICLS